MVRVVGTTVYESAAFHDLCDELGILVWQDLMFANLDYPIADRPFARSSSKRSRQALARWRAARAWRSCAGTARSSNRSAMLGLDPEPGRGELFGDAIPELVHEAGIDAGVHPIGADRRSAPFRTDAGVANYFGVGALPPAARRRSPRGGPLRLGVPRFRQRPRRSAARSSSRRHAGCGRRLGLRRRARPLSRELHGVARGTPTTGNGRHVTGELMAEVFGEWRRASSPCAGGIVLWLRDLVPGAGWGILDRGRPKVAWHHLRRAARAGRRLVRSTKA